MTSLAQLLSTPSRAGLFRRPDDLSPETLATAARRAGLHFHAVDISHAGDWSGALAAFGEALDLPDWYGRNLDALADCLGDLSWMPAPGYVLAVSGCAELSRRDPDHFAALLAALEATAGEWRDRTIPFWIFADVARGELAELPR